MIATRIAALWRGDAPLSRVFWEYAIAWGTLLNLATAGVALAIFLNRGPAWIALLFHIAPLPYNILMTVATWRAAVRERESPLAAFAKVTVLVWFALMLVI